MSFNVEQARGDFHNIVIMLIRNSGISIQEAMDIVGEWYKKRCNDFVQLSEELPCVSDSAVNQQLKAYVWGLGNWVTGNYEWSLSSRRYFEHPDESGDMRDGVTVQVATALPNRVAVI